MVSKKLAAHTNGIKEAQNQNKMLPFHNLSPSSQNEFINLCGWEVQNKILDEVRDAKYFSIIVYATPDVSHHEQIILVVRYVQLIDKRQYGFRENHSSELAITSIYDELLSNFDNKLITYF